MRYVVFDFDGPLFDGRKAAAIALERTLTHFDSTYPRPSLSFSALALFGPKRLLSVVYPELGIAERERVCLYYLEQLHACERNIGVDEAVRWCAAIFAEHGAFSGDLFRTQDD